MLNENCFNSKCKRQKAREKKKKTSKNLFLLFLGDESSLAKELLLLSILQTEQCTDY